MFRNLPLVVILAASQEADDDDVEIQWQLPSDVEIKHHRNFLKQTVSFVAKINIIYTE
jgi:hypothetical protein